MPQPKVFVSHSSHDLVFAQRFIADLRAAGIDAWIDQAGSQMGDFQRRINEALADCKWFVLVLTPAALSSQWVQHEVGAAIRLKNLGQIRDLIFIRAELVDHQELPPLWGVFSIVDAFTEAEYSSALSLLIQTVGRATVSAQPPISGKRIPVVQTTTRRTLFGDVTGVVCPSCATFNPLDEVERRADVVALPPNLWGNHPADCGSCHVSFYYTHAPLAER